LSKEINMRVTLHTLVLVSLALITAYTTVA
jgi:hypothetical protein